MALRALLAALTLAAALLATAAPADARTTYRGQWLCDDRGVVLPLPGMNVELWKRGWDWLPVEISGSMIARRFTNNDGTFSMTSPDDGDNYFVRMALRDRSNVHLKDFWGINDWSIDSEGRRNDRPVQDLGGLVLRVGNGRSPKCAIWRGVHLAHQEYQRVVGSNPPQGGQEIQADAPTAGTPFTPHTSIWWASDFNVARNPGEDTVARHEFGHAFRHAFDGDLGHFLGDVVTHNYLRHHSACDRTGLGFAFNEGWAEYWARDFAPAPDCPGIAADDFEVEGNVGAALQALEERCARGNRRLMVDVLRANPGVIHSFQDFRDRLPCPAPAPPAADPPPPPPEPAEVSLSPAARAALARAQVRRLGSRIGDLRADLRVSLRRAGDAPRCVARPCRAVLEALTSPAGLRTELALARLSRKSVRRFDSAKEVRRWDGLAIRRAVRRDRRADAKLAKDVAKAAAAGAGAVLDAARPVLRRDKSRYTRRFKRAIVKRLGQLKRAARTGRPPAALALDPAAGERLAEVPLVDFTPDPAPSPSPSPSPSPKPSPSPSPDPLEPSTLTVDTCAYNAPFINAGGKLTPPHPGTELTVTFTRGPQESISKQTKTDAQGNWTSSQDAANFPGTWTVKASWPGDADTRSTESTECKLTVP